MMIKLASKTYPNGISSTLYDLEGRLVLVQVIPGVRLEPIYLKDDEFAAALRAFQL